MKRVDLPAAIVFMLAAMAGVGLAAVIISAIDTDPPITFENVKVMTENVPQGGVLDLQYLITQNRVCTATVERFVTDSEGTVHVPVTYTVDRRALIEGYPPEGRETYSRSITVPLAAATGPARYDARFSYVCNIWNKLTKPIIVMAPTASFTITPAPSQLEPLTPNPEEKSP